MGSSKIRLICGHVVFACIRVSAFELDLNLEGWTPKILVVYLKPRIELSPTNCQDLKASDMIVVESLPPAASDASTICQLSKFKDFGMKFASSKKVAR